MYVRMYGREDVPSLLSLLSGRGLGFIVISASNQRLLNEWLSELREFTTPTGTYIHTYIHAYIHTYVLVYMVNIMYVCVYKFMNECMHEYVYVRECSMYVCMYVYYVCILCMYVCM